jgi:hypothetical protein
MGTTLPLPFHHFGCRAAEENYKLPSAACSYTCSFILGVDFYPAWWLFASEVLRQLVVYTLSCGLSCSQMPCPVNDSK